MKELISYIAKAIVSDTNKVELREYEGQRGPTIELKVAEEDLGKVIGKSGRTAQAMRTLLGAASARSGKKYALEIVGPEKSNKAE